MGKIGTCPQNQSEVTNASERLGCKTDEYGNNQYMCLPDEEKTSFVELCHDGLMGLKEKGHCLEVSNGKVILRSCKQFIFGCPEEAIRSYEYYQYKACLEINFRNHCYKLDPSCPSENGTNVAAIICGILASMILIQFVIIAYFVWKKIKARRVERKINGRQSIDRQGTEEEECFIDKGERKINGRQSIDRQGTKEEECFNVNEQIQHNPSCLGSQQLRSYDDLEGPNNASSKAAGREKKDNCDEIHTNFEGRNNASSKTAGQEKEDSWNDLLSTDEEDEDEVIQDAMERASIPKRKRHDTETSAASVESFLEDEDAELDVFSGAPKAR